MIERVLRSKAINRRVSNASWAVDLGSALRVGIKNEALRGSSITLGHHRFSVCLEWVQATRLRERPAIALSCQWPRTLRNRSAQRFRVHCHRITRSLQPFDPSQPRTRNSRSFLRPTSRAFRGIAPILHADVKVSSWDTNFGTFIDYEGQQNSIHSYSLDPHTFVNPRSSKPSDRSQQFVTCANHLVACHLTEVLRLINCQTHATRVARPLRSLHIFVLLIFFFHPRSLVGNKRCVQKARTSRSTAQIDRRDAGNTWSSTDGGRHTDGEDEQTARRRTRSLQSLPRRWRCWRKSCG